jgi:hypothetical protein
MSIDMVITGYVRIQVINYISFMSIILLSGLALLAIGFGLDNFIG